MKLIYWLFLSLAIAHDDMDMNMDNGMDTNDMISNTNSQNDNNHGEMMGSAANSINENNDNDNSHIPTTSMVPIPHVMKHMHGVPILKTNLLPEERLFWENYNITSYINCPGANKSAMSMYFTFMTIGLIFINPLLMVINNLNSQSLIYLGGLFINSGLIILGLFNYSIFINSIPNLYPGNVFNKFNWIYLFTIIGQFIFAILKIGFLRQQQQISQKISNINEGDDIQSPSITLYDLSRNQSPNSFDLNNSDTANEEQIGLTEEENNDYFTSDLTNHLKILKSNSFLSKIFNNSIINKLINNFGNTSIIIFNLLNWFNFLFIFVYLPTGITTFGLYGKGNTIFNLLAHFIKGGIFFFLGVVSLARYCGAFENKGWAWNFKFVTKNDFSWWTKIQPQGLITMEFIECFLIFFYGSTNIFMEHLANPGGEWSAKDLEHVSIAFIYIGAGLSGLLIEHKLSTWRFNYSKNIDDKSIIKSSPGFSPNPFPLLTIFWTGILMSKHQQASELSTAIHTQWGNMFVYATAFRFFTYILQLLLPKLKNIENLVNPSQPITELVVSFCLISGGMIFMESCDPIILSLEYRGYDAMFTLNLFLGVTFLIMAWIIIVFQFKNVLKNKYYY